MKTTTEIEIKVITKNGGFVAVAQEGYVLPHTYASGYPIDPDKPAICTSGEYTGFTFCYASDVHQSIEAAVNQITARLSEMEEKAKAHNEQLNNRQEAARSWNERGNAAKLIALYRDGKLFTNDNGLKKLTL